MSYAGPPQGALAPSGGGGSACAAPERRPRIVRRAVHGVLLLDKPLGLSSNQALQRAKWLLRADKAGHTGTLDPLATGVLPLCFGAATKFSQMHLEADKGYETTLRLGIKTSTADAEGEVLSERPVDYSPELLEAVLQRFTGHISQIPPMHSALKKDGKALYEYARAGIEVERQARDVVIYAIKQLQSPVNTAHTAINLRVDCSKGTYIRTLGEDIGEALGCGAHLSALRRVRTGNFDAGQCISLDALEAMSEDERLACLLPVEALMPAFVPVTLDSDNAAPFLTGMRRRGAWADEAHVAVYAASPKALLGTAHVKGGELIPVRLLSPLEISETLSQQMALEQSLKQSNATLAPAA